MPTGMVLHLLSVLWVKVAVGDSVDGVVAPEEDSGRQTLNENILYRPTIVRK